MLEITSLQIPDLFGGLFGTIAQYLLILILVGIAIFILPFLGRPGQILSLLILFGAFISFFGFPTVMLPFVPSLFYLLIAAGAGFVVAAVLPKVLPVSAFVLIAGFVIAGFALIIATANFQQLGIYMIYAGGFAGLIGSLRKGS